MQPASRSARPQRSKTPRGTPLRPTDPEWHARIGAIARTIGSDDFHVGLARLLGDMLRQDYIVIVRYPLGGLPDILFLENFGQHHIDYYLQHAYETKDPFYATWRATGRSCVLPLSEALRHVRDPDFYPTVYQPKLGIADEVAVMLEGIGGACLGLFFGRRKGRFAARELDRLRLVFPAVLGFHKAHLGRLFTRLVEKARPRPAEPFAQPTSIVTRAGDHIYSNQAWRKALRGDPGIARAAAELAAARSKKLRLPSGAVLHMEKLDNEFALAPGGRLYVLEVAVDDAKAGRQAAADFDRLTPREREIVRLIIVGAGAADIAKQLRLSKGTVKNHRLRIYRKLGLSSERALFMRFMPLAEGLNRPVPNGTIAAGRALA